MTWALLVVAGLAASGHCVLMCGPFAAALGAGGRRPGGSLAAQALYQVGKLATYAFLGALAASTGGRLLEWRRPLGIAAGAVLVAAGLRALLRGVTDGPTGTGRGAGSLWGGAGACAALAGLLREVRPAAALSFGALSGFLPCVPLYAVLAWAAALASPGEAAVALVCFGLGTGPALLLAGLGARLAAARALVRVARTRGALLARAAGVALLLLGGITLARSLAPAGAHLHLGAIASLF